MSLELDRSRWVASLPPVVLLPPTLADFECEHGELGDCSACTAAELVATAPPTQGGTD